MLEPGAGRVLRGRHVFAVAVGVAIAIAGVLLSPVLTGSARAATPVLVSLGDSFSAGEGAGSYDTGTLRDSCHRSANSYDRAAPVRALYPYVYQAACSGATSGNLVASQGAWPAQLKQLRAEAAAGNVAAVTFSFGGNDVGFSTIAENCIIAHGVEAGLKILTADNFAAALAAIPARNAAKYLCLKTLGTAFEKASPGADGAILKARLVQIRKVVPHARIIAVGYPRIVATNFSPACPIDKDIVGTVDNLEHQLNGNEADAARAVGGEYVSTWQALNGHELCHNATGSGDWVNHARQGKPTALHPTANGQLAMSYAVAACLRKPASGPGRCDPKANPPAGTFQSTDPTDPASDPVDSTDPGADPTAPITDPTSPVTNPTTPVTDPPPPPPPPPPNITPLAQSLTYTFNKKSTILHQASGSGTDPDGSIVSYNLVAQSFGTSDFGFTWNSSNGVFTMHGTNINAHLSITYTVTDNRGAVSAPAYLTIYFR